MSVGVLRTLRGNFELMADCIAHYRFGTALQAVSLRLCCFLQHTTLHIELHLKLHVDTFTVLGRRLTHGHAWHHMMLGWTPVVQPGCSRDIPYVNKSSTFVANKLSCLAYKHTRPIDSGSSD